MFDSLKLALVEWMIGHWQRRIEDHREEEEQLRTRIAEARDILREWGREAPQMPLSRGFCSGCRYWAEGSKGFIQDTPEFGWGACTRQDEPDALFTTTEPIEVPFLTHGLFGCAQWKGKP